MTDVKTKYFQTPKEFDEYCKNHGPVAIIARGNTFHHYTLDGTIISWGFTNSDLNNYHINKINEAKQ